VKPEFPAVPGNECVAEVLDVGPDTKCIKPGDLVIPTATGKGTWRSHAVFDESDVMKVPDGVGVPEAATICEYFLISFLNFLEKTELELVHAKI
jgi:trans-2-enoyl-CoA reductase